MIILDKQTLRRLQPGDKVTVDGMLPALKAGEYEVKQKSFGYNWGWVKFVGNPNGYNMAELINMKARIESLAELDRHYA